MIVPTELMSVIAGALTLLVVVTIAFGHRYADKSAKLDEKTKIDELNEIRIAMRSDATIPVLDKVWRFLVKRDQKMREEGENFDINSLLYDIEHRDYFNKLINDLERTFRDNASVRETWEDLRALYGKLGNTLYGFGLIVALVGYPLLVLSSQFATLLSPLQCYLLWILLVIIGITFLGLILHFREKAMSCLKNYKKSKEQYNLNSSLSFKKSLYINISKHAYIYQNISKRTYLYFS